MNMFVRKALISMGYRKMKPDVYGKPVATSLYLVRLNGEQVEWENRFRNMKGEIAVWDREEMPAQDKFSFETALVWLKYQECWKGDLRPNLPSNFEFASLAETLSEVL